jgi:ribosomal protein L35AE/L33A
MELRIMAFKGSPWQCGNTHEAVLEVRGRNARPDELLGAHLVWKTQTGRVVRGKVVKRHGHLTGNKLVARFHKGLPGQALGSRVEVRTVAGKADKRTPTAASRVARTPAGVGTQHAPAKAARAARPASGAPAQGKPAKPKGK